MSFINDHRARWGVEPICRVLKVAPSTYYAARSRPPSPRAGRDAELKQEITRVYKDNFSVYGARKVWRQLQREGIGVGRDRVARLMGELGIGGVERGSSKRKQRDRGIETSSAEPCAAPPVLNRRVQVDHRRETEK